MNIRCPQCQSVFRVDPEKVPALGVKARCARCSAVFALNRNGVIPPRPETVAAASPVPAPVAAAPVQPASAGPADAPAAPRPIPPMPMPGRAYSPSAAPTPAAAPAAPGGSAARPRPSFGKQDPHTRANRIARALVSDIVAYHRERRDQTLAAGTIKLEFREEIRKSWEEYVEQVGLDLARSTPYFRDALNAILANGQAVF